AEGNAREVKNRIQAMRKEAGFAVEDRIAVAVDGPAPLLADLAAHASYLQHETLAVELALPAPAGFAADFARRWDIDGHSVAIAIRRHRG
ncbi:MAG TPA: DUF5915 domain-containing protein, partial [Candidatus Udaeobacter sp.]|nr:DUF5915 domain-containing protein [Candidatus Udaeobacter sp.]